MNRIRLAAELALPVDIVTESIAILARKRAGKSYAARRLVEQLHKAGQQIVVVDPKGDWWGIRSSQDGRSAGLPIVILGGEHGDVPLEVGAGELVARLVVEERASVLLDLSDFRKHEVATFMTAFLEPLYRLKRKEAYRTPVMLAIDEADAIAPQKGFHGEERMLGAAEDIVRRGGQRGIGVTLITQRAAVLNKNVLTQCGILVLLTTTGSQDLDALEEWIRKHGQPEQKAKVMETIAGMPRGTAWVWAPGWPDERGIFQQVKIAEIETFDSGATPKPGEKRVIPKTVADVDLEAFRKQMAATVERAKATDPKELQKEVARLRAELRKVPVPVATRPIIEKVNVPILKDAQVARLEKMVDRWLKGSEAVTVAARDLAGAIAKAHRNGDAAPVRQPAHIMTIGTPRSASPAPLMKHPRRDPLLDRAPSSSKEPRSSLIVGERRILVAIAQHPDGVTREQLTVLTGYKRSSRDTYLQKLHQRGLVTVEHDRLVATQDGVDALGRDYEPLPVGGALRNYWMHRLPEGERRILVVVTDAYPRSVDRDRLSEVTDYKRSSRDTYLQKLSARRLIVSEGRGAVRAANELFDAPVEAVR